LASSLNLLNAPSAREKKEEGKRGERPAFSHARTAVALIVIVLVRIVLLLIII